MKISYAVSVCDESEELYRLLDHLHELIDTDDEIIVLRDLSNTNSKVTRVIEEFKSLYKTRLTLVEGRLDGDFASFKNKFIEFATGDYLFQIDADEMPHEFLVDNVKSILQINRDVDCFYIPRVNKVTGITQEHIQKWGWRISKLEGHKQTKTFDLLNPDDLKEYELLKSYDLIIHEQDIN
jgi:hypothetical protein